MTRVSVVVPTWNRRDLLERLLKRLSLQTYPTGEVVVVDDGSTDGSAELAEQSGARLIRLESNRGFSFAVNRGIEACRSEWVAVVNNDVDPSVDWLERLMEASGREPGVWFATGKIYRAGTSQTLDGAFDLVSRAGCSWRAGHGRPDGPEWNRARRIAMTSFTAAVFRRELFEAAGLLDEAFGSYLEDVDFGLRCAGLGLSGLYVPAAVAWHAGSATLGRWSADTVRRLARNQVLLALKYAARGPRGLWPVIVGQTLWGLVALRHGCGGAFLRGKIEGLRMGGRVRRDPAPATQALLEESEREMRDLQQRTGSDLYWRLYFLLT